MHPKNRIDMLKKCMHDIWQIRWSQNTQVVVHCPFGTSSKAGTAPFLNQHCTSYDNKSWLHIPLEPYACIPKFTYRYEFSIGTFIEEEALSSAVVDRDVERSVVVVGDTSSIAPIPISLGGIFLFLS